MARCCCVRALPPPLRWKARGRHRHAILERPDAVSSVRLHVLGQRGSQLVEASEHGRLTCLWCMSRAIPDYVIDDLDPSELNLVLSSWARSYQHANEETRSMRSPAYYRYQRDVIDEILARYPVVLAARTADGVVLGWAVGRSEKSVDVLDYVYVKSLYRRHGVGTDLVCAVGRRLAEHGGDGALMYTHRADRFDAKAQEMGMVPLDVEHSLRGKVPAAVSELAGL